MVLSGLIQPFVRSMLHRPTVHRLQMRNLKIWWVCIILYFTNGYGHDLDGDPLTYQWSVLSVPSGSTATDASFQYIFCCTRVYVGSLACILFSYRYLMEHNGRLHVVMINIGMLHKTTDPLPTQETIKLSMWVQIGESQHPTVLVAAQIVPDILGAISCRVLDPNGDDVLYVERDHWNFGWHRWYSCVFFCCCYHYCTSTSCSSEFNTTYSFEFDLLVQDCETVTTTCFVTYTCSGN